MALRIVCDRELEIEQFKTQEYWSIVAALATAKNETFQARLVSADGKKLEKFDIADEATALRLKGALEGGRFAVTNIESKSQRRNPAAPFSKELSVIGDRKIPYDLLLTVLYTAGQAELENYRFVVLQKGDLEG